MAWPSVTRSLSKLASAVAAPTSAKSMLSTVAAGSFALPDLPYDYAALQPAISAEIMEIHHTKHHQTYVTNLAAAMEQLDAAVSAGDVQAAVALQGAVKFNGGGHVNHSIFWQNLAAPGSGGGGVPEGALGDAIAARWGDFETFKSTFNAKTAAVQGSGWGWLGYNKASGQLEIATCANQDPLEPTTGLVPLLGIDVWEHAYYLQYKNVRPNYLNAVWEVVNFGDVSARFDAARAE